MKKLVIFDFDGTIADSMWTWDALGRETLEEKGLSPLLDYESVIRTMSVPDFSRFLAEKYPSLSPADELMAQWHNKMVYNYLNRVGLKEGIVEFLEHLKKSGVTVYLASATRYDVLIQAVKHFGLEKYFDYILTEECVGATKREPKIYLMCAQRAGCNLEDVYLFEDAAHAVKTAKSIGIKVCALSDYSMRAHVDEIKATADMYIDDFTNIEGLKKFIEE